MPWRTDSQNAKNDVGYFLRPPERERERERERPFRDLDLSQIARGKDINIIRCVKQSGARRHTHMFGVRTRETG